MGLETGNYISDLVITNPAGGDDRSTSDDHHRLIKKVLKQSFPNVDGAVNPTPAEFNKLAGLATTAAELAGLNGLTASRAIVTDSSGILTASSVTATELGYLAGRVSTEIGLPVGAPIPYAGTSLPSKFLWCDGKVYSRTTYSALYTALGDTWFGTGSLTTRSSDTAGVITIDGGDNLGLTTSDTVDIAWSGGSRTGMSITGTGVGTITVSGGAGDILPAASTAITKVLPASNVFCVPDLRGRTPFGLDNMGGTAASRIVSSRAHGVDGSTQGSVGGVDEHQLTEAEMPSHQHPATAAEPQQLFADGATGSTSALQVFSADSPTYLTGYSQSSGSHQHPAAGGDAAHTNLPPAVICPWIIYAAV